MQNVIYLNDLPYVLDLTLGAALGFTKPHNVTRTIDALLSKGFLDASGITENLSSSRRRFLSRGEAHKLGLYARITDERSAAYFAALDNLYQPPPPTIEPPPEPKPEPGLSTHHASTTEAITIAVRETIAALLPALKDLIRQELRAELPPSQRPVLQLHARPAPQQGTLLELPLAPRREERWYFLGEAANRIGVTVTQLCAQLRALRLWQVETRRQETSKGAFAQQISEHGLELCHARAYHERLTNKVSWR